MIRPLLSGILLTLLLVASDSLGQTVVAADVEAYAGGVAKAHDALQRGDGDAARKSLDATDESLRGTAFELLRHLAEQEDTKQSLAGIAAPKPDARFALALLDPTRPAVAYVCDLGIVLIYDLDRPQEEPKKVVSSRQKPLLNGAFSGDGAFFVAGDTEGGVTVWDTRAWAEVASFVQGTRPVRFVTLNHDGSQLLAETEQGAVLLDVPGGQEVGVVGQRYNFGTALCFSGDQLHCATGGLFSVAIIDAKTGKQVREIKHAPYTMHVCFSPDGRRIASGLRGSLNSWLGVFDVATGETVFDRAKHAKGITGLLFLDDGKCLLSTSADGTIKFWHVPSGTELLALNMGGSVYQPAVSADGRILLWNQRGGPRYFRMK